MQPGSQMMGQQMQMEGSLMLNNQNQMMPPGEDSLMLNQIHNGLITNGIENAQVEQMHPSLQSKVF